MDEGRSLREATADGVFVGYAEARVSAGVWRGRPQRFWRMANAAPMSPADAEAVFDQIAGIVPQALVN